MNDVSVGVREFARVASSTYAQHSSAFRPTPTIVHPSFVAPQTHRPNDDLIGQLLADRYRISELIGEGRAGAVYLSEHIMMKKRFALKLLHPELAHDAETVARFRREAEALSHLEHPHLVGATDFGRTADGAFFLVMEYVEGTSLRAALGTAPLAAPFPAARAMRIARQIALALGRAHREGIVHRDIKPENVMLVNHEDDPEHVKVLDFGVARFERGTAEQALTRVGAMLGTPEYMAPEQAVGDGATPASDLYALGVVLFEMLAGQHPFDGDPRQMLSKHVVGHVPTIAERAPTVSVHPSIEALVHRLLEKEPNDRFPTAEAVVEGIDEAARAARHRSPARTTVSRWRTAKGIAATAMARVTEALPTLSNDRRRALLIASIAVAGVTTGALVVARLVRPAHPTEASGIVASVVVAPRAASGDAIRRAAVLGPLALEELSNEFPGDGAVLRELAFAYDGAGRAPDALRTVERAANAARGAVPRDLVRIVARAASKFETVDEAFRLLEEHLGPDGVEALLELSADSSTTAETRARASRSLAKPSVRKSASEATGLLVDLHTTSGCEAKRQALARGGAHADARALTTLRALKSTHGCGRHGGDDCHPCLRKDPSLDRAIVAAEQRAAQ